MTSTPRIGVVIVTHETRDEVLGCLASIEEAVVDEVVVVDTGSTDGTVDAVRARHADVVVLELANAGFGRAANAGVRRSSSDVVVVSNADVRFAQATVETLARYVWAHDDVAMAGPAVRYPTGERQASARRVPDVPTAVGHAALGGLWRRNPWSRRYHAADVVDEHDAEWLSGCAFAVRRTAFDQVGGFDPGYFLFVEDVDLCVRLRRSGWRLRYLPDVEVTHMVGASTRKRRIRSLVEHARSLDRFDRIHGDVRAGLLRRAGVRAGLVAWVLLSIVTRGRGRTRTGTN